MIARRARQRPVTILLISDGKYGDDSGVPRRLRDDIVASFRDVTTYAMTVEPPSRTRRGDNWSPYSSCQLPYHQEGGIGGRGVGLEEFAGIRRHILAQPNLVRKAEEIVGPKVRPTFYLDAGMLFGVVDLCFRVTKAAPPSHLLLSSPTTIRLAPMIIVRQTSFD